MTSVEKKRIVALLPMKTNSERVKRKNFRDFNGKPLFFHILNTLLSLPEIEKVIINTDASHILSNYPIIKNERVVIRDRNADIRGDTVSMNFIIQDDINNISSDIYLMTHATNPLLSANTIKKAIYYFLENEKQGACDSLFTVNRIQTRFYRADGSAVNHSLKELIPTQNLEPWFEENSNLYIFTKESFKSTNARIGKHPILFETSRLESIDIDTEKDWDFALLADRYLNQNNEILCS